MTLRIPIPQKYGAVQGYSAEFVHALWMMSKERGGGYIPVHEIEKRAESLMVIPRLPLPLLPAGKS